MEATLCFQDRFAISQPLDMLFMVATLCIDSCEHFQETEIADAATARNVSLCHWFEICIAIQQYSGLALIHVL
jgi:hypothetical protein